VSDNASCVDIKVSHRVKAGYCTQPKTAEAGEQKSTARNETGDGRKMALLTERLRVDIGP
jgi:hypothetical protein